MHMNLKNTRFFRSSRTRTSYSRTTKSISDELPSPPSESISSINCPTQTHKHTNNSINIKMKVNCTPFIPLPESQTPYTLNQYRLKRLRFTDERDYDLQPRNFCVLSNYWIKCQSCPSLLFFSESVCVSFLGVEDDSCRRITITVAL